LFQLTPLWSVIQTGADRDRGDDRRYVHFEVDIGMAGLLLHGIRYDYFFVAGQIFTNRFAGDRFRSSARGLITLATYGVGILIGSLVSGPIVDYFATADAHQWRQIWVIPAIIAAVVRVLFLLLFKDRSTPATATLGLESEITTLEAPGASLPMPRDANLDR
jgi:MFS family permease